jgi:hypothetical protein
LKTQYLIEKLEEKDYLVKRIDFVW